MSMDLTGITNKNEYYTNHYFATVFEENAAETISAWNAASRESEELRSPWSMLRRHAAKYYAAHDRYVRSYLGMQTLYTIKDLADGYLNALGYPEASPMTVTIDEVLSVSVYLEMKKPSGAPLLWVILMASTEMDAGVLESHPYDASGLDETSYGTVYKGTLGTDSGEDLATKILFGQQEPPRFLIFIGMNQIALIDRNKWNEKRYLQFELEEIFSRLENTTLQAMSVLLHRNSLCPDDGKILLDELDEQSVKNASGVSQDLKYALRESIELLGNEVLYDMRTRQGRDLEADPVDAGQLTIECLRYMYRMLFVLFIEARPELGYAPIKAQSYYTGYSLESLRDIADNIRDDISEVGNGYYLHETLAKLYDLIYDGYPKTEEELKKVEGSGSLHDLFLVAPLKAHIFDPEYTKMITQAKLRNSCMLRIIELMSLTKSTGRKNSRRGRISYANLGINQMGAVYEALLSYRGFIAEQDLYEVKRAGDHFDELDVGYFVPESELDQYTEDERVRYETDDPNGRYRKGQLRRYEKGTFIYRLAGREREKSASYYTPEVLTKCLVKYALKELLEGKTADEILDLTVCEPAMGSAAFLNETINQLAEAYISRKEQETGKIIGYEERFDELQKVKMYIADRNVYGIDLNPVAVELAEVSLWLNTIYEGGFVPWFGTQLVNGNSLIGARRQVYPESALKTSSKGLRWYENAPERVPLGMERKKRRGNAQIYHFLLGDPGMCNYTDKVIKQLEPDNIKKMKEWNKKFTAPYSDEELETLRRLSLTIDELWEDQIRLRETVEAETQDSLSIFGREDTVHDSHTTIRQKDEIYSKLYKSEHMKNAGPYARLKFAMDYWCALWFWPIDQAELLPARSEFFNDLNLILVGTINTGKGQASIGYDQLSLFDEENEELQLIHKINEIQGSSKSQVDLDSLCMLFPRLALVRQIAEQNHFMHWELEFADLFAERGGFDLVIGNPPWILLSWDEQAVLSDSNPMYVIKERYFPEDHRQEVLSDTHKMNLYREEYESITGQQSFMNTAQNYGLLVGMKANLYKGFLPQAWKFCNDFGVSAFIHPDGVFDDPKGGTLRSELYSKLRRHYQFSNELKLFPEVDHHTAFSLNVYSNKSTGRFDCINNLFTSQTIEQCYDEHKKGFIPGLKDRDGNWNTEGHPGRIVRVGKSELELFAELFDGNDDWKRARLPNLHAQVFVDILKKFSNKDTFASKKDCMFGTVMWSETNAVKEGTTERKPHFPEDGLDMIYSGPHFNVGNPFFKASRRICKKNSDYDNIDLAYIPKDYFQRCTYGMGCDPSTYLMRSPNCSWGRYIDNYRVCFRRMLNQSGERTLISALIPPKAGHIHTVVGVTSTQNEVVLSLLASSMSLPFDAYIKMTGRSDFYYETSLQLPFLCTGKMNEAYARALMLNALTTSYSMIWKRSFLEEFTGYSWAKTDSRLSMDYFRNLEPIWTEKTPIRVDYARRQALVEMDVLIAMELGLNLDQLITMYRIQFPVLQSYEADTWYDANGRIVFTNNRGLTGVGFSRPEWEKPGAVQPIQRGAEPWDGIMKHAPAGYVFARTITDDTMPGGPVERTIEYVAPFDRCDREQDYEIAWKFFEERNGRINERR